MPRKICVVVTARPSYSRIRTALRAIEDHPELELQLVVAASALLDRYGSTHQVIERDGFKIARKVYMIVEGENPVTSAKSTGIGVADMATVLDNLGPDIVVTIADRFETMATAIAASYMNLPLVHIQGGEVTGSIDEKVRHAITKLADFHLVSTDKAVERVIKMGEYPERVYKTGCPSIDLAVRAIAAGAELPDPIENFGGVGDHVDLDQPYIVVLQHPVTTEYTESRQHVEETLYAVRDTGIPTLWLWPNVDAGSDGTSKGIRSFRERYRLSQTHFFKNFPPEVFIRVLYSSKGIVGNSSVAIRECEAIGVPAVNIGSRQSGRERGDNVEDVGYDREEIAGAIERMVTRGRVPSRHIYGDGEAGPKIAAVLADLELTTEKRLAY